jgi:hypothetical protein
MKCSAITRKREEDDDDDDLPIYVGHVIMRDSTNYGSRAREHLHWGGRKTVTTTDSGSLKTDAVILLAGCRWIALPGYCNFEWLFVNEVVKVREVLHPVFRKIPTEYRCYVPNEYQKSDIRNLSPRLATRIKAGPTSQANRPTKATKIVLLYRRPGKQHYLPALTTRYCQSSTRIIHTRPRIHASATP